MPKKADRKARRQATRTRRDRRARLRRERAARMVELELDSMRHRIAVAHARGDAEAAELRANDSGRGWNESAAWSRHYEESYQWCDSWTRGQLEAELARLAALKPGEGPLDFLAAA